MKRKQGFLFDYNFCIGCKACEISCQVYHNQDPDINWRHVDMMLIHEDEIEKEIFITHSCHHCDEPACMDVCPVGAYIKLENGIVQPLHDKCIGCGYCLYACPFSAPQFPRDGAFSTKGAMDKCTMCAGGPEETFSHEELHKYGQNRIAEGKVPMCAAICSTNALIVGDAVRVSEVYRKRVLTRGTGL